ncbi:hypothetical protein PWT90_02355 [Aphanocladium album]|nr:hypothetical protein PWT90_02355 [Aphanocladium album]
MWYSRKDDPSCTCASLMIELPDGDRTVFTYAVDNDTRDLGLSVQTGVTEQEGYLKLARIFEKDINDVVALCQSPELKFDAATPVKWVENIIQKMYWREIISIDEAHRWIAVRDIKGELRSRAAMDDLPLKEPMYQPLWRIKHNGEEAIAIEASDAPPAFFIYSCSPANGFEEVEEITAQDIPAECTAMAWFFEMDRETVKSTCKNAKPPADSQTSEEWVESVVSALIEKSVVFWKGDSQEDLIAFAALDPPSSKASPTSEKLEDGDEITYESDEEYFVDFFLPKLS